MPKAGPTKSPRSRPTRGCELALGSSARAPSEGSGRASRAYYRRVLQAIEPTDESLVRRVSEGHAEGFAVLYDRYSRGVYAWRARLLCAPEGEGVVQRTIAW